MISMVSSRTPPSLVTLLAFLFLLGSENKVLLKTGGSSTSRPALVQTTFIGDSSRLGWRSYLTSGHW